MISKQEIDRRVRRAAILARRDKPARDGIMWPSSMRGFGTVRSGAVRDWMSRRQDPDQALHHIARAIEKRNRRKARNLAQSWRGLMHDFGGVDG